MNTITLMFPFGITNSTPSPSLNTGDAPGSIVAQEDTGINEAFLCLQASLVAQLVKNSPAMQETPVRFLGREDPLEKDRLPTPVFLGIP